MRTSLTLALPLFALPLVAGLAQAQSSTCAYYPDSQLTGGSNVIPFGHQSPSNQTWRNQKYQALVPAARISNVPRRICELAFVPATSGLRQFSSITVKFNHTKLNAMSTTFANNLGTGATTVLDAKNYFWTNVANRWNRIGLQKTFLFVPQRGNLIIEIEVRNAGMPASNPAHAGMRSVGIPRLFAFGWTTNPPATGSLSGSAGLRMEFCFDTNDAWTFGRGCPGSNKQVPQLSYGGSAKLGSTLKINLSGGIPSRPVVLLAALSNASPFPVDLTGAGAPGCWLYIAPQFPSGAVTDRSGNASLSLPIPKDGGLSCARFYNQFFPLDPQLNKLGFSATNYGRVLLGN